MDMNDVCLNICRLCAEATTPQTCIPLYNEDKHERIITKQINQLITNLISPDDGLPQEICLKCSKNVELCYSFLSGVIATQNKLKRLIFASEQKTKLDPNKNQFDENSRFENVTMKENDKNTLSKSVPYKKRVRGNPEIMNVTDVVSENGLSKIMSISNNDTVRDYDGGSSEARDLQLRSLFLSTQNRKSINEEDRLYHCSICSKDFSNKNACFEHIIGSHPTVENSLSALMKLVRSSPNEPGHRSAINEAHKSGDSTSCKRASDSFGRKTVLSIDSICNVVRKKCVRYTCDVCGRLMTSWFAFKRHLLLHVDTGFGDYTKSGYKKFKISNNDKPFAGYCRKCNKLVEHFQRHNTYHAIVKLEFEYPDFVKLFSM